MGWVCGFFPQCIYSIFFGGLAPGFITAIVIYFASKPLVKAYQQRRRGRLMNKIKEIRDKREAEISKKDISK